MGKLVSHGPAWSIVINVILWAVLIVLFLTTETGCNEEHVEKAAVPSRMGADGPCSQRTYRVPLLEVRGNHEAIMARQTGQGAEESIGSGGSPQAMEG